MADKTYPEQLVVSVRREHITEGQPDTTDACPIALAVLDVVHPEWPLVFVEPGTLTISTDSGWFVEYDTNPGIDYFIDEFDHKRPVEPQVFEFEFRSEYNPEWERVRNADAEDIGQFISDFDNGGPNAVGPCGFIFDRKDEEDEG